MVTEQRYTADQIVSIGGRRWEKNGLIRVYLNDWSAYIGLEVERYKTDNIAGAWIDEVKISNAKANRILYGRVYWEDGRIVANLSQDGEPHRARLLAGIAEAVARASSR